MRLFQSVLSPFAARCRVVIYGKKLAGIELADPPGGRSSQEFKRLNPSGKIPALEAEGRVLAESEVICEYLEDRFPTPALMPTAALDRAQVRLLTRTVDLYLYPPLTDLYLLRRTTVRDPDKIAGSKGELLRVLGILQRHLSDGGYVSGRHAVGGSLSLADGALATTFVLVEEVMRILGEPEMLAQLPLLEQYRHGVQQDPICGRVMAEMREVLARR